MSPTLKAVKYTDEGRRRALNGDGDSVELHRRNDERWSVVIPTCLWRALDDVSPVTIQTAQRLAATRRFGGQGASQRTKNSALVHDSAAWRSENCGWGSEPGTGTGRRCAILSC